MPPKKKGKKKKKERKEDPNALTEVDKTFYELTITDLNRKLARLRSLTTEYEEKNEQLQSELNKLDEDRNDIIIYLKRTLQEKSDEIAELQERLTALEETRLEETENYESKISDLQNEYKQMHEQLTSEIKLLEGKLNSLEEFRIQRDELMKKFEEQEIAMEEQEKRHKNELYDIERKFIIGKDKLKKEMEARLLQLSSDFQEATELRIAATTHRVIRENIAINNELDSMLDTHNKLYAENTEMKKRDKTLRQASELYESEKKKALGKVRIQMRIIERLTNEHEEMTKKLAQYQTIEKEMNDSSVLLQKATQENLCLNHRIRILEQNVHALKCKELSMRTDLNNVEEENMRLSTVLAQAVYSIKEVLEVQSKFTDEALRNSRRESLLSHIFLLLSESEKKRARRPSLDTIGSLSATYQKGDLGFVPKPMSQRSSIHTFRHIEAQTGPSFDEFLAEGQEEDLTRKSSSYVVFEEESGGSEMSTAEEESDVFFNEEEESGEESLMEFADAEEYGEDGAPKVKSSQEAVEGKKRASQGSLKKEASKTSQKRTSESILKKEGSKVEAKEVRKSGSKRVSIVAIDTSGDTTATSQLPEDASAETDTTGATSPLPEDST